MHVEARGVEEDVGDIADGVEALALGAYGGDDCFATTEGMWAAGLGEAANDGVFGGFEEDDACRQNFARMRGKRSRRLPSRTSTTRAACVISADFATRSAKRGMSSSGRLSTE
jgi:hypothetical protein